MRVGPGSDNLPRDSDEQVILARARAGDRQAFKLIYDRYSRPVYTYLVYATPHLQDAEDLTQEVFLAVWRKLHQFRGESRFST